MDLYTFTSIVEAYKIHDNTKNLSNVLYILTSFYTIAYI